MVQLVLTAILLALLTACGTAGLEPSSQMVQRAIALQLEQTQQQLSQQLGLDSRGFEINRVAITQQEPLVIQNLPTYHVRGTYDLTVQLSKGRITQKQNPFEVYLQRQKEGKTWRFLLPQSTSKDSAPTWRTYLIK